MSNKEIRPFGAWESPVTTDLIAGGTIGLGEVQVDNGSIAWIEMRPEEKGRYVVVRHDKDGKVADLVPENINARTRVHEYGGGSYLLDGNVLYTTNFSDQRLYRIDDGGRPRALTPQGEDYRFADFVLDEARARLIAVMEHHHPDFEEPKNCVAAISIDADNTAIEILVEGADFYSNPRLSPDGSQLCWLSWQHPNMSWDVTELWCADIDAGGRLQDARRVAGGAEVSVLLPRYSPSGILHFVSDRSGWWNLYRVQDDKVECLLAKEAEFGIAQWSFRESTYAFRNENEIVCTWTERGHSYLGILHADSTRLKSIKLPYTDIESVQADAEKVVFIGGAPDRFPEIVRLDLDSGSTTVLKRCSEISIEDDYISAGEFIEFPTQSNLTAYAFYYPPKNPRFKAPEGELPPLLVCSHGGPTGMAHNSLKLLFQFFTSRGIAMLDVNYGGSSGFGRAYRQRLNGNWGIVDVDDCVNAALYLADQGRVDRNRLAIRGASAGGFTTLAALTFRDVFKAGASRYGVSDLEALTRETHKFESRYLDGLIGPWPERADLYHERSPIHAVDRLSCPVIFLQGLEDRIVLPNQSEMMVEALRKKGLPVAYLAFEGEQHGFRQANNIKRALEAELYFFASVFGFEPADVIEPVTIYR
jgi:dipeptidyl aminopeptidase/acylaminoacyl peptidase